MLNEHRWDDGDTAAYRACRPLKQGGGLKDVLTFRLYTRVARLGSFSAAARRLRRAQSAVSELVSGLEAQIGVTLFDRSGRYPKLTPEGLVLLADARGVISGVDFMKARAKGMA